MSPLQFTRFDVVRKGEKVAPRVIDYTNLHDKVAGDFKLTEREEIEIVFSYPLGTPTRMKFAIKGGFTLSKFWECVYMGYLVIYNEEPEPQPGAHGAGLLNRGTTKGKYCIWGHGIEDLFLEGYAEVEPGVFELVIGS